ncbi:MAG: undecaprenyldiphospho-muramoylpentapeptide beta-N-acetylglucosaminyltransferase [Chitinophagaceae bacterium]
MSLRVIIAGGGTGGHIFPAIAIANAIRAQRPAATILFVGAKGKMEMEKVPKAGYRIIGLDIAGFNRSSMIKNISLPWKIIKSLWQTRNIFKTFLPDVVVGVGGYASFPMLQRAQQRGIPTLIQEQNSYAGKANRFLAKKARVICVAYESMERFFPSEKLVRTGNPVRNEISSSTITREAGLEYFGLRSDQKVLLIVGGSLGARSVNQAIASGLASFAAAGIQLVWQTGKRFHAEALAAAAGQAHVKVYDFIERMDMAYAAADVVVSRAGALSIAELCVAAKPVLFVPYPYAAEDHQTENAKQLMQQQACMMMKDDEVAERLVATAITLVTDTAKCEILQNNIAKWGVKDADQRIAHEVIRMSGK